MYHKAVSRKPCPESLEAYTFKGGNLWPVALRLLENRLARCLDCIEQAITLRNSRVGGNHKGPDGLGGVDLPILDPKNLLHVFFRLWLIAVSMARPFFPTHPSGSSGETMPKLRCSMFGGSVRSARPVGSSRYSMVASGASSTRIGFRSTVTSHSAFSSDSTSGLEQYRTSPS